MEEELRLPIPGTGSELAIRVVGPSDAATGLSILYLHGLGSSQEGEKADFFRRSAVAAGVRVWSLDFRGHGRSGGEMRGLTLSRNLADIERVREEMDARGERRVVLLGSSMGALSGLWHAARDPDRTAAGLFIAPALGLEESFVRLAGHESLVRWEREGAFPIQNELGSWEIGWELVADLRRHPSESLAGGYRVPTLILQGKLDDRVDWRAVTVFADRCPRSVVELELFDDGDHRLVDRKDLLWGLMTAFLRRHGLLGG